MPNDGFNGTTAAHGANQLTPLLSVTASQTGEIPVPGAGDSTKYFEAGIPVTTTTVEVLGSNNAVVKGDSAALVITWADGGTFGGITTAICTNVAINGSLDAPTSTTYTFMPAA
jgi:hypothetical protein